MQQTDNAWSWSEAFTEIVERVMREPLSDTITHWDRRNRLERLRLWQRQVDTARELYREGHAETLGVLYDYWRTIADDVREQVGFARESYHELSSLGESPRRKPAGIVEWRNAEFRRN
jgi:hypothetical protein